MAELARFLIPIRIHLQKRDVEGKGWELLRNTVGCCKIIADDGQHLLGPTDKVTVAHARGNTYG